MGADSSSVAWATSCGAAWVSEVGVIRQPVFQVRKVAGESTHQHRYTVSPESQVGRAASRVPGRVFSAALGTVFCGERRLGLSFWRPKVLKSSCQQPFWKLGGRAVFWSFPASRASGTHPFTRGPFLHLQSEQFSILKCQSLSCASLSLPLASLSLLSHPSL